MKNKVGTIIGYILVAIIVSPIIACLLFIGLGGLIFYILVAIRRIKYGPLEPMNEKGKIYKYISTAIFLVGIALIAFVYKQNVITWTGWLWLQLVAFVGFIPLEIYFALDINKKKNEMKESQKA